MLRRAMTKAVTPMANGPELSMMIGVTPAGTGALSRASRAVIWSPLSRPRLASRSARQEISAVMSSTAQLGYLSSAYHHMARDIGHHGFAQGQVGIDAERQRIAQVMRLPGEGETPRLVHLPEGFGIQAVMVFGRSMAGPGHDAPHEDETLVIAQGMTGAADQRILADPRGAYDQDE